MSIQKFFLDNNGYILLTSSHFYVKKNQTHAPLLEGKSRNELYQLWLQENSLQSQPYFTSFLGIKTSLLSWHSRLGHPSNKIVSNIIKTHHLHFSNDDINKSVCNACQLGKSSCLPSSSFTRVSSQPLNLIHNDVWHSPVQSISGYKYHAIFVDDNSRYTWLYPLRTKVEVLGVFCKIQAVS